MRGIRVKSFQLPAKGSRQTRTIEAEGPPARTHAQARFVQGLLRKVADSARRTVLIAEVEKYQTGDFPAAGHHLIYV